MTEHRFRGPQGRLHLPQWTTGCYHERPIDCCWCCLARLFVAILRQGVTR